ncbi:type II 3-dehydroquinate dehydratase [Paraburkholderia sp. J94]|nr:type II 3-dehydroquinate dehydratase [Paraburkholderia sp. J94]
MSNIQARGLFRHQAVFTEIVAGQICGLGLESDQLAMQASVTVNK